MTTKLDLHLHTRGSDGTGEPKAFVKAIGDAGLDGIVITDHHRTLTAGGLEVVKAVRAAGFVCLVGCEYSTKEGHCLVFGVDVVKLSLGYYPTIQSLISAVASMGGVAFPSHPFRGVKETLGQRIYDLQGLTHVEAYNGQNEAGNGFSLSATPAANQKAVEAALAMGLAQTGGSDAHSPGKIGTCYTEFGGTVRTVKDLVLALKARDHIAVVNQEMVASQRKLASFDDERWKKFAALRDADKDVPWWQDPDGFWTGSSSRDNVTSTIYIQEDEEDPAQQEFDGFIPEHAFNEPGIDDPEAVQRFLAANGIEWDPRKDGERKLRSKRARASRRSRR